MEANSEDAFAFLYAVSNALAMQGIYIHKVKIRSVGHEAVDQFFIADRWGKKIQDPDKQHRLRTAVAMIKQFTRFLPEAPDPAKPCGTSTSSSTKLPPNNSRIASCHSWRARKE
jgi:hypothetical protein